MPAKRKYTNKSDILETITSRIETALEAGTAPWVKPWRELGGAGGIPKNFGHIAEPPLVQHIQGLLHFRGRRPQKQHRVISGEIGDGSALDFLFGDHLKGHRRIVPLDPTPVTFAGVLILPRRVRVEQAKFARWKAWRR